MNGKNSKPNDDRFLNDAANPQANNQLQTGKSIWDSHKHRFWVL